VGQSGEITESIGEIVARMRDRAAEREMIAAKVGNESELKRAESTVSAPTQSLLHDHHHPPPTRDFFVADILDWALKDDRHSMEHPIFSLSKNPDRRVRKYEHNGNSVIVKPGSDGLATIWDKDVLIYLISQVVEGLNRGREDAKNRRVRFRIYDYLISTNRPVGGEHYKRLEAGLDRLKGTTIKTNVVTGGTRIKHAFGLIDDWRIVERSVTDERMMAVEVSLSEWLYNAITAREVLTLNRDYFQLGGSLERRLYELARKHCGYQSKWTVGMELLHKKSGSSDLLKRFRAAIKRLVLADALPEYRLKYDPATDQVHFHNRDRKILHTDITTEDASERQQI
jgi:plasmid replication initiation protein